MRILTRYILREVTSYAVLGGALFTFVLFMRDLGRILELAIRGSAPPEAVLLILLYTLPATLILTVPMSVLVGTLLGLGRLSGDSEITAMRASGFGVLSFVRIVSLASLLALAIGLVNSLYVVPRSAAALLRIQAQLRDTQASFEVQPRVFYEDLKNYVLYVQDVRPAQGASLWRHVFLADLAQPATPHITTAENAVVLAGPHGSLRLHFQDGSQHEISVKSADGYDISTFTATDTPIQTGAQEDLKLGRLDTPLQAMSAGELWQQRTGPQGRLHLIELNRRLSYPAACIVLMLVGVPLGLSSRRGGKSTGFVLTISLVFIYYFLSSVGVALAKQGKLPPSLGVWAANLVFAVAGGILLRQMSRSDVTIRGVSAARTLGRFTQFFENRLPFLSRERSDKSARASTRTSRFPLIFDDYVMREFLTTLALVLFAFVALSLIFNFFELLGDIIRNRTPLVTVGSYLIDLIPYMLYNLTPLCSLLAVLITFGTLSRSGELTAMMASGVSIYRLIAPVLALAAILAALLFTFDDFYLPSANRRQEALRSVIKGRPAQTFSRPDRKWISGEQDDHAGVPARIFYYQFFDPDKDVFANLTIFEFQPGSFQLGRRVFAANARWNTQ